MKLKALEILAGGLLFLCALGYIMLGDIFPRRPSQAPISPPTRVERDIPYGPDPQQQLDVYLPEHAQKAPIILMVHGGGWIGGDRIHDAALAHKLAQWGPKGYIIVSVDYRLVPDVDPWTQANDVAKALAFVQNKAASWGGDPSRIVLMGHSAGAHLISLVASNPKLAHDNGVKPWLGTISLDTVGLNVETLMRLPHQKFCDQAFGADPTFWRKVSPTLQLKHAPRPMLVVCSLRRLLACPQALEFTAKASALGGQVSVVPVLLSHGQVNQDLGLPSKYTDAVNTFLHTLGLP